MRYAKSYLLLVAVLAWFALIAQLYLIIYNRNNETVGSALLRYFTYFTILTNLLVAVFATTIVSPIPGRLTNFFSSPGVQTALTVYIAVVGLVYNIVLRQLWNPQDLQRVVDETLHTVNPILFLIYWFIWVPKTTLTWSQIPAWLIFPAVYAIIVLILGAFSGYYPYPFLDVNKLSYPAVFRNSGWLVILFLVFSLIPVSIGTFLRRK
jgi:hypothetical protein